MILGGVLGEKAGLDFEYKSGFILFPLLVHSLDLIVSTIGVLSVQTKPGLPNLKSDYGQLEDPLDILKRGYYISLSLAIVGLFFICSSQFPKCLLIFLWMLCNWSSCLIPLRYNNSILHRL